MSAVAGAGEGWEGVCLSLNFLFSIGVFYCWFCSQHQSFLCISLCALFTEPMVGKVRTKRPEENARSSICVGTADAFIFSWLVQHSSVQHNYTQLFRAFPGEAYIYLEDKKYPVSKRIPHAKSLFAEHAVRGYESVGRKSLTDAILVISPQVSTGFLSSM